MIITRTITDILEYVTVHPNEQIGIRCEDYRIGGCVLKALMDLKMVRQVTGDKAFYTYDLEDFDVLDKVKNEQKASHTVQRKFLKGEIRTVREYIDAICKAEPTLEVIRKAVKFQMDNGSIKRLAAGSFSFYHPGAYEDGSDS